MGKYTFQVTENTAPKPKPDLTDGSKLGFGTYFTDHMFVMDYNDEKGWHGGRIVPYGPFTLDPAAAVLHYAIEMFEGMKAYKSPDGRVLLFRPDMNFKRINTTADRICIPKIDPELMMEAIKAVVDIDRDWIPTAKNTSLYIRPFVFADDPYIGVHPARSYKFAVILSPVGSYYQSDDGELSVTKIFVEDEYSRAMPGGTGFAKIGANYVISLKAQEKAVAAGCSQVLYLDCSEKKYVQEIGTSNAFFVIHNEVVTAPLDGMILPGITRDTILRLLEAWNVPHSERKLSIDEVFSAAKNGTLNESFASGTAAVISPVGAFVWKGETVKVNGGKTGPIAKRLYDEISAIQNGRAKDEFGWTVEVK